MFISFLVDIVGKDVMEIFSLENKYDFLDFLWDFEIKKRIISFELDEKVFLNIFVSLLEIFCEKNLGSNIKDVILKFKYKI